MASSIDPTKPAQNRASSQSVRDNFLALKNEIEDLQVSTDPEGFKLVSTTSSALGPAVGGTYDARIAYDTDKIVIVRDSFSTYWGEMSQRRVLRGTTVQRPTLGSVVAAANLYYNTDTSTLQLDNGVSWVTIGPGGSGGETLTENVETVMAASATSTVSHPSVPLTGAGSGEIRFSVLATTLGIAHNTSYLASSLIEDLNSSHATWVQDAGDLGHFSVSVSANVVNGCELSIEGDSQIIVSIVGGGTGASSVTLDAAHISGAIDYIHATYGGSNYLYNTFYLIDYSQTPGLTLAYGQELYNSTMGVLGKIDGFSGITTGTGVFRLAFSLDDMSTWLTFTGTAWSTITLNNLETSGLRFQASGYVLSSAGVAIASDDGSSTPPEGWGTLRTAIEALGLSASVYVAVGFRATANENVGLSNLLFTWHDANLIAPRTFSFGIIRLTDTTTKFTNNGGTTINDVHCQVWTV